MQRKGSHFSVTSSTDDENVEKCKPSTKESKTTCFSTKLKCATLSSDIDKVIITSISSNYETAIASAASVETAYQINGSFGYSLSSVLVFCMFYIFWFVKFTWTDLDLNKEFIL